MKLYFGLGNPGKKYQNTRHNIGQMIVSKIPESSQVKTATTKTHYMNESGVPVQEIVHFYKIKPEDLYIIHDDLNLPVGEWKIQFDRGPAGHHGVESVIQHLGTQAFWRVRVGIGRPATPTPIEDYVLQPFTSEELVIINDTIDKIVNILGH